MGIVNRIGSIFKGKVRSEVPALPNNAHDFWYTLINGPLGDGGAVEGLPPVQACKAAISESVSMLPASVFKEESEKRTIPDKEHYLYELIKNEPNPLMDSFEFFELMQNNLIDHGQAFAHITKTKTGRISQLLPLSPKYVKVDLVNNKFVYRYNREDFDASEIFHIKAFSKDGVTGRSPLKIAKDLMSYGLALQMHGQKSFESGAFLSGFITTQGEFKDDEARKNFMDGFKQILGAKNSGKFGLLEQGTDYKPFSMSHRDSQFNELIETFAVLVAMVLRVPPQMIQVMKGMSFASVEQLSINYVQYTIQPWVTRWERAIKRQLLRGQSEHFVRFNVDALLRGDLVSRTNAIVQQLNAGLRTINEAKHLLDINGSNEPAADMEFVSHNLRPLSTILDQADPKKEPQNQPETPEKEPETEVNEPETDADEDRSLRFRALFEDILGRIVRKELAQYENAKKKDGFFKWAETFLVKHRDFMIESLTSAVIAFDKHGSDGLKSFVSSYIETRQAEWLQIAKSNDGNTAPADDSSAWAQRLLDFLTEG